MKTILLVARRELQAYLHSSMGYIVMGALLLLCGLAFNAFAMSSEKPSFDVLRDFFYWASGFSALGGILFSMRLFAEEKQTGTLILLETSPASELELVLGKFLGGYGFLLLFLALTAYMPMLVVVNGTVTWGHLWAGYFGLALLGAAVMAMGTLSSLLAPNQLVSAVYASALTAAFFIAWLVAKKIEGPLGDAVGYLDLFDQHYRSLSRGVVRLKTVIYFLSLTYTFLLLSVAALAAKRWRA